MRITILTIACTLLLRNIAFSQNVPAYIPTDGLVAWYPFNGNANDESGNGNNGTVNGAVLTTDKDGNENSAYSFDGVDDYIDLGDFIFNSPSQFSISVWVKFDELQKYSYIFSQATNGEIQIVTFSDGTVGSWNKLTNGGSVSVSASVADTEVWHHLAVVFDEDQNKLKFIIDGQSYETSFTSQLASYSGNALIGRRKYEHFFHGTIDNIIFWNRALTEEEIRNIYYEGNPPVPPSYIPTDGLVAWYPFNGNANDESGNGNNGTVNGAVLTTDKDGRENSAYSFDGVDDYIEISDYSEQFEQIVSEITISSWFKDTQNDYGAIIARRNFTSNPTGERHHFELYVGPDNILGYSSQNNVDLSKYNIQVTSDENVFEDNIWNNVIIRFNSSDNGQLKVYLNGKLMLEQEFPNHVLSPNQHWINIGRVHRANGNPFFAEFKGQIDDIAIWNRALTEEEILAIYNEQEENTTAPSKLSILSLHVDSSYTKRGFKFSNYVSLDTLAASDSLISYQFDLEVPQGVTFDSIHVFHSESTPSVASNYVNGLLSVVTTGSGFITSYDPLLELFFTPDTLGTYLLTPRNVVLNSSEITSILGGVVVVDPFIIGDVDDSGVVQGYDASIILHKSVGSEIIKPDPINDWESGPWFNWRLAAADVDIDGEILAQDAALISQYVVGIISDFPTSTPEVESVDIVVTNSGLKISAPEDIHSLNVEISANQHVEFGDPEISWKDSSIALNKIEGIKIAIASSSVVSGDVLEIPLSVYTNDNIVLEVITITNNTKKVHEVIVSGLLVDNEESISVPQQYVLSQNYPNPFNPSTRIQYALPEVTHVTLEVFNSVGQKVMELVNGYQSAGYHSAIFDASGLSNGLYLYKLTTPSFTQTMKMMLVK